MSVIATWVALVFIAAIGTNLLLHKAQRREDRGDARPLPADMDPANLRRRRPLTNRLSGAVLLMAVAVIVISLSDLLFAG